jgi:hypothetical protein
VKFFAIVISIGLAFGAYHMFDKNLVAGIVVGVGSLLVCSFLSDL